MAKTKIIQPYVNVPYIPLNEVDNTQRNGAQFFRNVKELSVGFGAQVFRVDRNGMWAGAETFATAPWSVDWQGNMVASSITLSGYVPTGGALDDIGLGGITAGYINVSSLSAISANIGSVTSGTVTGALIRTSSTGSRVEIDGSTDDIRIYDAGNDLRMKLDSDDLSFYNTNGTRLGYISTPTTTNFTIATLTGNAMILDAQGTNVLDAIFLRTNSAERLTITETSIIAYEDILAGTTSLNIGSTSQPFEDLFVDDLRLTAQTSNPTSDGMMRYYNSGGNEGIRCQFGGSDFQFDATAV